MDMKAFLEDLAATKVVRVTGSYADGSFTSESDIDFKVKEARLNIYGKEVTPRPIDKVKTVCDKHGIKLGSSFIGSYHTHNQSGNGYMPVPVEFSEFFKKRPNKLSEVELYGVKFQTW